MRTVFWNELLSKCDDIRATSNNFLARSRNHYAILAFHYAYREQTTTIPSGMQLHRAIAPHANRAFSLAIRGTALLNQQRIDGAIMNLAVPALVFDDAGRIIRVNSAAEAFMATNTTVRLGEGGTVTSPSHLNASAIDNAIRATLSQRRASTLGLRGSDGMTVVAHFVPMQRREANNALVTEFIDVYEPAGVMYISAPSGNV
ncbi:hypothetical protein L1787_12835 [Acuticoccus sp. M5D2P5]|uniref:hypothetical protein n=1 Tax=Acuticoccus kalidii TaxID=2910977 RepID=UPI001F430AC5|nr:hypothetical protein [Acuticoccus kalidii]MCF3934295.1 hypothetical protein [Acuticoccus kalidii]